MTFVDGDLLAAGPDYRARISPTGLTFEPKVRHGEARDASLRFELTGIGRGTELRPVGPATLSAVGLSARLSRPEVVEAYEVRADGVEQTFTLAQLPAGEGDLVISGELTTSLPEPSGPDQGEGIAFVQAGLGGVKIGTVLGIDACGERMPGSVHWRDGRLELRLPAEFVERAALPLLVDPLIGSIVNVANTSDPEALPDVAYDDTNAMYLVVWEYRSGTDSDIRAQRVDAAGALVGGVITVRGGPTNADFAPRVANISVRDKFLAVWTESPPGSATLGGLWAASIDAATGVVSSALALHSQPGQYWYFDVSGESTIGDDDAIVCSSDQQTPNVLTLREVQIGPGGVISVVNSKPAAGSQLALSKSGGSFGHHMLVAQQGSNLLRASIFDRNLNAITTGLDIVNGGPNVAAPAVDGDGRTWLVAWESATAPGDRDIPCRMVMSRPGGVVLPPSTIVEGDAGEDEASPSVAWLGVSFAVAFADSVGVQNDTYVKSLDPFSCALCEGEFPLEVGAGAASSGVRLAAQRSGYWGDGDEALLAFEWAASAGAQKDVQAQRYRADDGVSTGEGGGCTGGGLATAACAVVGNSNFTLRLRGALPGVSTWLVLGARRLDAPCGPCTLVPSPFAGVVFPTGLTDANGDTAVSAAMPNDPTLRGAKFLEQWIVASATAPPCTVGLAFSNCIEVTIE